MTDIMIGARIKDTKIIEKIQNCPLSHTQLINSALRSYFFPEDVCKHAVNRTDFHSEGSTKDNQKLAEIYAFIITRIRFFHCYLVILQIVRREFNATDKRENESFY